MSRRLSVHSRNILCTEKVCVADHKQFRPVPTLSDLALRTSSVEAGSCVDIRQVHGLFHIIVICHAMASCLHGGTAGLDQIRK